MSAADLVGALMGLGPDDVQPLPPSALVKACCGEGRHDLWGTTVYTGSAAPYSDGFEALADLTERGWFPLPSWGAWPFQFAMAWPEGDRPAMLEYVEGDLTVWSFPTKEAMKAYAMLLAERA